jgi:hypothetical protein
MAKAQSPGKDQTEKYNETNPEDTARGGLKTPVYGRGKITHSNPEYPAPASPPNPTGHQHVKDKK